MSIATNDPFLAALAPADGSVAALKALVAKGDYQAVLSLPLAQEIFKPAEAEAEAEAGTADAPTEQSAAEWHQQVHARADESARRSAQAGQSVFLVGLSALLSFAQATITGPPLPFSSGRLILPTQIHGNSVPGLKRARQCLVSLLSTDEEPAYRLTPHIELLAVARALLSAGPVQASAGPVGAWAALRAEFMYQKVLSGAVAAVESSLLDLLAQIDRLVVQQALTADSAALYLLEKAAIFQYYREDQKCRSAIADAVRIRQFQYVVTGRMGKRTKFQTRDVSQLVVLAKSADGPTADDQSESDQTAGPVDLPLEDDTLLSKIQFTSLEDQPDAATLRPTDDIPAELAVLDTNKQPLLNILDSVILLSLASAKAAATSSISQDELTREEMGPFVARVLQQNETDGDRPKLNWQVYTDGLIIRSRIEAFHSRTVERGLLQLVALRDQVVQDTTDVGKQTNEDLYQFPAADEPAKEDLPDICVSGPDEQKQAIPTFLPQPKAGERIAPAEERLLYAFALGSPYVWNLESELAELWSKVGGLRSAMEIYQRLEMWAEAALCLAGSQKEEHARALVRRQLFEPTPGVEIDQDYDIDSKGERAWQDWKGPERSPLPLEAPRLYCILGDLENNDIDMYQRAWDVSNRRYARAQKRIGKLYYEKHKYADSVHAFKLSLRAQSVDHESWFMIGCCHLRSEEWKEAADAFSTSTQLQADDFESWINLSASLISLAKQTAASESEVDDAAALANKYNRDSLQALKHAAKLRREDHRVWDNIITIGSSLDPIPYNEIIVAFRNILQILGPKKGDAMIDESLFSNLVRFVCSNYPQPPAGAELSGEPRMLVDVVDTLVIPLITTKPGLWRSVARLEAWQGHPAEALAANEKAWRCATAPKEWENGIGAEGADAWARVADATGELADAYESFGQWELPGGELLMKDWRFKARSAIRGILGRAKSVWEGSPEWDRLQEKLEELKSS